MFFSALCLAVFGVLSVESLQVSQCDSKIVNAIKAKCNENNDILEKIVAVGDFKLKRSSPYLVKDEYYGVLQNFKKEDGDVYVTETLYRLRKDGNPADVVENEVIEAGGSVQDKNGKQKRFCPYFNTDKSIVACYFCLNDDKAPEGPPAGFVLGKESNNYRDVDLEPAQNYLKAFGVETPIEYNDYD